MFTNFFFIILVLLLVNFSSDVSTKPWIDSPWINACLVLVLYCGVLILIFIQSRLFKKRHWSLLLTNLELIAFLSVLHFVFGTPQIINTSSQTISSAISLTLYLFGLWFFHTLSNKGKNRYLTAWGQLRLIIPFTLPFFFFSLLDDLFTLYPALSLQPLLNPQNSEFIFVILMTLSNIILLAILIVFFPPVLMWFWQCRPLEDGPLKSELQALCQRAEFCHAGLHIWKGMPHALNAAIVGILPRYRYVIFTENLLHTLDPDALGAVLAHEIGHSFRKHLLFYPCLIFGMLVFASLFSWSLTTITTQYSPTLIFFVSPLILFTIYALFIACYFRLVFGFFSRQFERQADLHIFHLGISPNALKDSLLTIARYTGICPNTPCWHHYSIQERVNFINRATQTPSLIATHHKKVRRYLAIYFALLSIALWFLFAPELQANSSNAMQKYPLLKNSHSGENAAKNGKGNKMPKETAKRITTYRKYFQENRDKIIAEYLTFLRFPSISSEPAHAQDMRACANWLIGTLQEIGFATELWETSGHPVVYATHLKAGPDKPTLLIYNHYDVQPVDPLDEWETHPFKPTIKDGNVYARGAQDNKGQCFYVIQALKAVLESEHKFPLNIKLCIEGEEEFASHGLSGILSSKQKQLQADTLAVVDLGIMGKDRPAVTLGVRGIITMDVQITGSHTDLHSGAHGGIAYNPIHALVTVLSKLRDTQGKITVPGFYDSIIPMSLTEKQQISFAFDEESYTTEFGTPPEGGESAFIPSERRWIRPTIEINGINGGYTGSGFKTVIPSKACAKLSCRLVPDQDPQEIAQLIVQFIKEHTPKSVHVTVDVHKGMGRAIRSDPSSTAVQAFAKAYEDVFEKPCEFILQGGSIPIVTELAQTSNGQLVLVGLGLASDQIHAPNEHFGLDRFEKGFLIITQALHYLLQQQKA